MSLVSEIVKVFIDGDHPPTRQYLEERFPGVKFKIVEEEDGTLMVEADLFSVIKSKHSTEIKINNNEQTII
jgi:hypothetical protein